MANTDLLLKVGLDRTGAQKGSQDLLAGLKEVNKALLEDTKKTLAAEAAAHRSAVEVRKGAAANLAEAEVQASRKTRDELGRFVAGVGAVERANRQAGEAGKLGFASIAAGAGAATVVVRGVLRFVQGIAAEVEKVGAKARQMSAEFASERDRNRELATLMGRPADDAFALDMARFNKAAAFRPDEGRAFRTELYNSGAQYEGKTISKPEFAQFGEQAGGLAVAKGLDAKDVGTMAGSLLGFTDFNRFGANASEEALAKVNSALATLGRGKGDNAVLARQFSMLSSASLNEDDLKGTFNDPDQVAAVVSVAAEKHDAQAAELSKIAIRAMRGYDKEQGGLLKRAGVEHSDDFIGSLGKLNTVVQAEVKNRQATMPGFKTEDFLRENFGEEMAVDALNVFLNKGVEGGGFADRLAFAKENAGPEKALGVIKDFQSGQAGQDRAADADLKLAQAERASKSSDLTVVRKQALARLVREERIDTNATGVEDFLNKGASFGLIGDAEQKRIDDEVQRPSTPVRPAASASASPAASSTSRPRPARRNSTGGSPGFGRRA